MEPYSQPQGSGVEMAILAQVLVHPAVVSSSMLPDFVPPLISRSRHHHEWYVGWGPPSLELLVIGVYVGRIVLGCNLHDFRGPWKHPVMLSSLPDTPFPFLLLPRITPQ